MLIRNKNAGAGFSLLEVMIGMLILALGILGSIPLLIAAMNSNSISRDFAVAGRLAKDKMEYYQAVPTITGTPIHLTDIDLEGRYSRQTYVFDKATDTTLDDGIYKVDVIVSWDDDAGVTRSSQYTTLVRKDAT